MFLPQILPWSVLIVVSLSCVCEKTRQLGQYPLLSSRNRLFEPSVPQFGLDVLLHYIL